MEFCKMRPVNCLIPEDSVNGEVFGWLEALLGKLVQHARRNSGRVRPQQVLLSFCHLPGGPIPAGPDMTSLKMCSSVPDAETDGHLLKQGGMHNLAVAPQETKLHAL